MSKIYAVAVGRDVGIFDTWEKCEESIKGFPNAKFKKFSSLAMDLAEKYIATNRSSLEDDSESELDNRINNLYDDIDELCYDIASDFNASKIIVKSKLLSLMLERQ